MIFAGGLPRVEALVSAMQAIEKVAFAGLPTVPRLYARARARFLWGAISKKFFHARENMCRQCRQSGICMFINNLFCRELDNKCRQWSGNSKRGGG